MKKQIILFTILISIGFGMTYGQVGIGTDVPDNTSIMDLTSLDKGFLPPRMTEVQRDAIASPPEGLVVYNTDSDCLEFFNGTCWICYTNMPQDGSTASKAAVSCKAIKDNHPSSTDGGYWLDLDGCADNFAPMAAYCDMTTDGGGWTLIGQFNHPAAAVTLTQRNNFPNRGSDVPTANETSGTGVFGFWGLVNQSIRQAIPMTEYRVESYTASSGFHFKSTHVDFVKNNANELPTGKTSLGKPGYWPGGNTYYNHCATVHSGGHPLIASAYVTFTHSAFNCNVSGSMLVSRMSTNAVNTNQGLVPNTLVSSNGLARLYVR